MTAFADAYLSREGDNLYTVYVTGIGVYEERFSGGELTACGWNGAGYLPQTTTVPAPWRMDSAHFVAPAAFSLGVDGIDLDKSYRWLGWEKAEENGALHVRVRLQSTLRPVAVTVHTLLDGTGMLQRWLTVTNGSTAPANLSRLTVMGGMLGECPFRPGDETPFALGYMHHAQPAREGDFHWMDLPQNTYTFGRRLYTQRYRQPFFTLNNKPTGDLFIGQLGFSGGYECRFHTLRDVHAGHTSLSFEVCIAGLSPLFTFAPGESLDTPAFHGGMLRGSLDDAVNAMHAHTRLYAGQYEKHPLLEAGIGPESRMDEDMVLHAMDFSHSMGAEVFFIDASWYAPKGGEAAWPDYTGDWQPRQLRYPSMDAFRARAHELGMKFGLWVDIEKLGPKSAALQDPAIPKLRQADGSLTLDGQSGILDLSDEAGVNWAREQICSIIDRYQLDFFRLDSGSYAYTSVKPTSLGRECPDLRYHKNLYDLFRRLREKYPHVVFQNCAGGGARLDLGMLQPMSNTWITDCQVPPHSFLVLNGVTMHLPPEYAVRPFAAQNGHVFGTYDFHLNTVRFSNPDLGYVLDPAMPHPPRHTEKLKKMLDTYKNVIRPMMKEGRILHHTPDVDVTKPDCVGILELASPKGDCAMLGIFTLSPVTKPEHTLRFKGLNAEDLYEVTVNDEPLGRFTGYELMHSGIRTEIPTALDSRVLIARAIE